MGWIPRLRRGRPTASLEGVDYLDLVPRKLVEALPGEAGAPVVLLIPRYRDAFWGRLLQPRLGPGKRFVRLPLEARGTALWSAIDGRCSVRELVAAISAAGLDDGPDLPRRTCLYLQAMADNGLLALSLTERTADGTASDS